MNKKGLTLVELLTVIVILSIIVVILFPTMRSLLSDSKSKVKSADEKSVREAAEMYVADHITTFSKIGGHSIPIQDLIDDGYLEIDVDKYNISNSYIYVDVSATGYASNAEAPDTANYTYSVTLKNK